MKSKDEVIKKQDEKIKLVEERVEEVTEERDNYKKSNFASVFLMILLILL